ncbi:cytochrome P450 [Aspergillus campestris IBT 28561]|uniref:Dihydromonacolin L monooxygenase LovA n=1 Tax=Aspergillus campestris (strain IBT 28561) TaxID=1392248 RepID=A0A2I1CZT3_ASPC2|nr:cytochrome P450 [Aspergillus campestris IBT 28561]PKY03130.1 cytochrome P450 [Aspergillus campestris IBT 28561]
MAIIAEVLENPHLLQGLAVTLLLVVVSSFYRELADGLPYRNIPIVGTSGWRLSNTKAKQQFVSSAKEIIASGFGQGKRVFQMMFDHMPTVVLHPQFVDEVKNHPDLNTTEAIKKMFFGAKISGLEAFEGLDKDGILLEVISKKLTQTLGQLTIHLSQETATLMKDYLPESDEWKPFTFAQEIPHMVARLSSLVFLGPKLCRDTEWLDISVNYTINGFMAARDLRLWPSILRPVVQWFLPSTKQVRGDVRRAKEIIQKEVHTRELIRQGKLPEDPSRTHADCLDWIEEVAAGRPIDATRAQIGFSMAAIHTTSNLLTNVMYDLTAYPEFIQPLRDEIRQIVKEDGVLKKTSLTKMKLMDSVMKESQRVNPTSIVLLNRLAMKSVVLSDGTHIPKGANVTVSTHVMHDNEVYPNAQTYDGFRFYKKRQVAGSEHRHQFVTTSPEHFGFGHGMHACPGRFFASNEIKIMLAHLLMKYDWKFAEGPERPASIMHGTEVICNPMVKLLYKSRQPEIDLAAFGEGLAE